MKKSLDHLPKLKRDELARAVAVIRALCNDVEMIILFGSYARGDWKEEADLQPDRRSGHKSDYDILVVTAYEMTVRDTIAWRDITAACDALGLSAYVRIIPHDIEFLNARLSEGQYFYTDVKKEGCLLYDSGKFKLTRRRKLKLAEQRRIAEEYYRKWFGMADEFYRCERDDIKDNRLNLAAFHLNQATESCYKAILLVFTDYCPHEHFLGMLGDMAAEQDRRLSVVFPRKTRREDTLFKLLDAAYIDARYNPDFSVTEDELEYLAGRVKILLELTEKICRARIESITGGR